MTDTIVLPLPRVVTGERSGAARGGPPERFCQIDDVPVAVASVNKDEAPEVLRLVGPMGTRSWHVHGGRLYAPVFQGAAETPDDVAALLRQRAREGFPQEQPPRVPGETVVDFRRSFHTAQTRHGLADGGGHRLRAIHDDGVAARDAVGSEVAARLLLAGGRLLHVSPAPYYEVDTTIRIGSGGGGPVGAIPNAPFHDPHVAFREGYAMGRIPYVEPAHVPLPWMAFEPWRGDEARRFAGEALAMGYAGASGAASSFPRFEVAEEALLRSATPDAGPRGFVARCAAGLFAATSEGLHLRSDAVLVALMAARAAAADPAGDPVAAAGLLRTYAGLAVDEAPGADPRARNSAAMQVRLAFARIDGYEMPGAFPAPEDPDMAALSGLAPG